MERRAVDVAVIGAGTAGLAAHREARRAGARALLIESGPHGTTCARVGCMPSKLLIAAADAAEAVRRAPQFGVGVDGGPKVDGVAVLERVRRERDRFVDSVLASVERLEPDQRLDGRARFLAPNALQIDERVRVEARAIVIATGSKPWVPDTLAGVRGSVITSDQIFELARLPESIAVFGAGSIGLELGQALARLGVRVALFAPNETIGPLRDPVLRSAAREVFARELELHLGVELEPAVACDDGVAVRWRENGERREARFSRILAATGRRPDLAELDLAAAELELDERGIPRFAPDTLQCGTAPIFLAGDDNDDRTVLHEAADEGAIAGRNAARFPDVRGEPRRTALAIVFTDPQIAVVGASAHEADVAVGCVDYADQGRARVIQRNCGLVRIYGERPGGRLLGAELFGPGVEHTAHLLAWAVQLGLDARGAHALPFYHPVLEEGIRTALRDLCGQLALLAPARPEQLECGPGA